MVYYKLFEIYVNSTQRFFLLLFFFGQNLCNVFVMFSSLFTTFTMFYNPLRVYGVVILRKDIIIFKYLNKFYFLIQKILIPTKIQVRNRMTS